MMSAKDEKHSLFATLWFNIAHFALRPWPWILVGLAALVILPREQSADILQQENPALYKQVVQVHADQALHAETRNQEFKDFYERYENTIDPGIMYPKLMLMYLPAGLLGMLIAVFLAAYMSTIASQLNWGTSYLINDFYRRFVKSDATEKQCVAVGRISTALCPDFQNWDGACGYFLAFYDPLCFDDHFWGLGIYPGCKCRYRRCTNTALVLVAYKCLVRNCIYDYAIYCVANCSKLLWHGFPDDALPYCGCYNGRLACCYLYD